MQPTRGPAGSGRLVADDGPFVDDETGLSEIVQRALEQYLGSMAQVQATYDQSRQIRGADATPQRPDTHHKKADCPYQECPFEDACPGESCPLWGGDFEAGIW